MERLEPMSKRWVRSYVTGTAIVALFLLLVVSCNEPTEVSINAPRDTLYHFDTLVVHDTIWCKYKYHRWTCLDARPIMED